MIIDTDVLIDYFRGYDNAYKEIKAISNPAISVVTLYELYQGARDKREIKTIKEFLHNWGIKVYQYNEAQSLYAQILLEKFTLSHGLKMADAMIAACAYCFRETLMTGNTRDYRFINDLKCKWYKRK